MSVIAKKVNEWKKCFDSNDSNSENTDNIKTANNGNVPAAIDIEGVEVTKDVYDKAIEYRKIMMIYESAIKEITTKLEILNNEYRAKGERSPIETIKSRIKSPESIANKLISKNLPVTFLAMTENLDDIAGVRIICSYINDIYTVTKMLSAQTDLKIIETKDYIKEPKPSGYRSLHIVLEVPVYLSEEKRNVRVEVQLRTIAMDFWASLEHELRYKTQEHVNEAIKRELRHAAELIALTDKEMQEIAEELRAID